GDGGAGVEEVAPLLGDVGGEQDLPGDDGVLAEALGPGLAERDLAGAGGGLALLQRQAAGLEPEQPAAERDRARGDDDQRAAASLERRQVRGQRSEPRRSQLAGRAVDEQG